ncbi:unnamed protein product [Albugo candida]|uniref:Uncharacterized protein n=1 Tax=Albugo candida TaxID=65357 RepID=A0A024GK03_9STRA|nr:unnamed protein product [Albugo candida]|eukprot:CCI47048.1 unnamed protein product [Albugo candida]
MALQRRMIGSAFGIWAISSRGITASNSFCNYMMRYKLDNEEYVPRRESSHRHRSRISESTQLQENYKHLIGDSKTHRHKSCTIKSCKPHFETHPVTPSVVFSLEPVDFFCLSLLILSKYFARIEDSSCFLLDWLTISTISLWRFLFTGGISPPVILRNTANRCLNKHIVIRIRANIVRVRLQQHRSIRPLSNLTVHPIFHANSSPKSFHQYGSSHTLHQIRR